MRGSFRIASGTLGLVAAYGCASKPSDVSDSGGTAEMGATSGAAGASSPPAHCVAQEPADEPALLELAAWTDLPTFRAGKYLQITSTDREAMSFPSMAPGNHDYNNYVCRGEGVAADGGAGDPIYVDSPSCPETYVKGLVAARVAGSGRLARLWATGLPGSGNAIFRIYIDGEPEPCIEFKMADAKRPPASLEIFAPPFGADSNTNLAWYYPVVFSKKIIVSIDDPNHSMWYQTSFVLDEQPTARKTATERLPARDNAKALLGSKGAPVPNAAPLVPDTMVSLPTDTHVTVATLTGPATVHSFRVRVPDTAIASLNAIDVAVTWDTDPTPAIAMPLGDLFASETGMADTATSSLPLAITKAAGETTLDLRLPMPFATKAIVVFDNHAADTTINVAIDGLPSLPREPWGHLAAIRSETVGPTTNPYHPIVTASGEGRLVGTCLMAQGHSSLLVPAFLVGPLNFLEGDEQIKVDGQTFRGTGTEDYFDSAFYFDPAAAGFPFAQWGGKGQQGSQGRMSACRWHILGAAIDFHQSLDFSIEAGPPDPATIDRYVSTAFLYRPR
jgi:Protein of unknown function (DUF2961)